MNYSIYNEFLAILEWSHVIYLFIMWVGALSALYMIFKTRFNPTQSKTTLFFILLAVSMTYLMGVYPIGWNTAGDRQNYGSIFEHIQYYGITDNNISVAEQGYLYFNSFVGKFLNTEQYFILVAAIYVLNYSIAIWRMVRRNSYWMLLACVISMGFVSYNVNVLRAGLAISFVFLAISLYPSKIKMLICGIIAISLHRSTMIPAVMMFVSLFFNKTKLFYYLWFLSIIVSAVGGDFFNSIFASFTEDNRSEYLTRARMSDYNVGFRIDFLIYSLIPLLIGYFYIYRKRFNDNLYQFIYNTYILTNIFWILVIRANYSDRFAYLSWFMIPVLLTYPLLKTRFLPNQNIWITAILVGELIFYNLI